MTGLLPDISDSVVAFIRIAYGVLLTATIVGMLPQARRFFLSERWGGYAESSRAVDAVQNPIVMPVALAAWLLSAVLLVVGQWTVAAALVNLVLARYFGIFMRWRGALRGMGAPGFMTYWLAIAVFLLELTTHHAPSLRPLALFGLQIDLGLIFLAAALYKIRSGYLQNNGMEFGLTNPQWGYWWRWYQRLPPNHTIYRILNLLAWTTELAAAVAILLPPTRFLGGLILIGTFAFIATQIRLSLLCEMVMLSGVLFFAPDTIGGRLIESILPVASVGSAAALPASAIQAAGVLIVAYIALLPFAYGGLVTNFYLRRRLPAPWQHLLEAYTNFFGIILWRVFSADLVNFLIEINLQPKTGGARAIISDYKNALFHRFAHVCEMIAITSIFTTLKYYPSNSALFQDRLLRYARTLPRSTTDHLVFEYLAIRKEAGAFAFVAVAEFIVDPDSGVVVERPLDSRASVRSASEHSPVHEGVRPGSYAPPV